MGLGRGWGPEWMWVPMNGSIQSINTIKWASSLSALPHPQKEGSHRVMELIYCEKLKMCEGRRRDDRALWKDGKRLRETRVSSRAFIPL